MAAEDLEDTAEYQTQLSGLQLIATLARSVVAGTSTIGDLQKEIEEVTGDLNQAENARRDTLVAEINALLTQLGCGGEADATASIEELQAERNELQTDVVEHRAALIAEINTIREQLEIEEGDDTTITASIKELTDERDRLKNQAEMAAEKEEMEQMAATAKAKTDKAKALKRTIDPPSGIPSGILDAVATEGQAGLVRSGTSPYRQISVWEGAASNVSLKENKDTDIATLTGGWKGKHFEGDNDETDDDKRAGKLRAYSNQSDPTMTPLPRTNPGGGLGDFANGSYPITSAAMAAEHIIGDGFAPQGALSHTAARGNLVVTGSYKGIDGRFTCTNSSGCTSNKATNGITLQDSGWVFTPTSSNPMTSTPDANYLEFGWWKREDSDGDPTHAGVFSRAVGTTTYTPAPAEAYQGTGSATYNGQAAGLFAVVNPRDATEDDSGYFTADATLTAKLGTAETNQMLSGTIDNFKLNSGTENPGWSVKLEEVPRVSGELRFRSEGVNDTATVWTIDGDSASRAGEWSAVMYNVPTGDTNDGLSAPDAVTGQFEAEFGSTHVMTGAFGAER